MRRISAFSFIVILAQFNYVPAAQANPAGFVTLDKKAPRNRASADMSLSFPDVGQADAISVKLDLHGNYMFSEWGIYGAIPLSFIRINDDGPGQGGSEFAFGNIEIGGMRKSRFRAGTLLLSLGFALPTAGDSGLDVTANTLGAMSSRIRDLPLALPDSAWLRAGSSFLSRRRRGRSLFWRIDAGIDYAIDDPPASNGPFIFQLNAAAGFRYRKVDVSAELANSFYTDYAPFDSLHTLAFTARWRGGSTEPYMGVLIPLSDSIRNNSLSFSLLFGLQFPWLDLTPQCPSSTETRDIGFYW